MTWDEWRGTTEERHVMLIKRLLWIPLWRWKGKWYAIRVDLHKFVGADDWECFHSHPAWAVRIVLKGGYVEEVYDERRAPTYFGDLRVWAPGMVGIVRPSFAHRIHDLLNGKSSYSLWIRGPVCADVKLLGAGWPAGLRSQASKV